jgi:hypothetical protein
MSHDPRRGPDADDAGRRLARSFHANLVASEAEAPSYDEVAAYVDGRLAGDARQLFEERLADDPLLRTEVQDLRELRAEMAAARTPRTAWAGWAAAAAVLAALAGGLLWTRGARPGAPGVASAPTPGAPSALAQLEDATGRVALRTDGTIAGVTVPSGLERSLAEAMRSGQVHVPALRADLAVAPVTAMGSSGPTATFGPLTPLSTIVRSDRPTLRFTPHPGASAYVVSIYDLDLEPVASSPTLRATEWTVDRALPRGRTYVWQIEARTPEGRLKAPAPPAAEARFHVAGADEAAKVEAALASGSHLAAGVALAEAGFLDEAREHFERLAALNPGSPEATKLLELSQASRPRR